MTKIDFFSKFIEYDKYDAIEMSMWNTYIFLSKSIRIKFKERKT